MVFNHSAKVPQTYKDVSKVLKEVLEDGRGLKNSIYESKINHRNKQRCLALASKILEKAKCIEHILETTQILSKEPLLNPWLARILIHELVWRKELNYECKPVQTILTYKEEIKNAAESFEEAPIEKGVKPRYIRINTVKATLASVIADLRENGMILLPPAAIYKEYLDLVANLTEDQFIIDFHIKDMLVFAPNFPFFNFEYNNNGTFVLMDKASCLAPFLLDAPKGSVVLDLCAAPGMKTNYYANQVGPKGRVYAVEYKEERYATLCKMVEFHGLKNVQCLHKDGSKITGDDLPDVEYISIDPSCSGSGMVDRIDYKESKSRLEQLSKFQILLLERALLYFPNVKRVVYSTCSIHPEENEEVVGTVLQTVKDFQLVDLQEKLKPNWNHFGSEKYENVGPFCVYAKSEKDMTNGFFVAVLERIRESSYKKRKFEKVQQSQNYENSEKNTVEDEIPAKKKNKNIEDNQDTNTTEKILKIKAKKKKQKINDAPQPEELEETKQKKKKKQKTNKVPHAEETPAKQNIEDEDTITIKKKKKKT